ncbi:MAG TPA: bifunctional MaoC family dehydratase N-terminal/OB-fold nucleic acid binding domain-containing protein [Acidimicrobiales bacterium]
MSDAFLEKARSFEGRPVGPPELGDDPVNQPMIRHWCEAIGDDNPIYTDPEAAARSAHGGVVAPPVMLQAWVMRGIKPRPTSGGNARDELMAILDAAGFSSVVATDCEQEYHRYLRPGDHLSMTSTIESISEEKKTALGTGHFITTRSDYHDQGGELVGSMRFRILKFRPAERKQVEPEASERRERPRRPRPAVTPDNAFFFEGARRGQLLIQRCASCGLLRHPPHAMCSQCRSFDWDTVEASGRATLYSFVVVHYPEVPAFDYPLVVGLVELEEGTRLVADVIGVAPSDVRIGMPLELEMVAFDDELTLPQFHPVAS